MDGFTFTPLFLSTQRRTITFAGAVAGQLDRVYGNDLNAPLIAGWSDWGVKREWAADVAEERRQLLWWRFPHP
jgi:hypothetical protein